MEKEWGFDPKRFRVSGAWGLGFWEEGNRNGHPTMHASYESRDGMRTAAAAARPGRLPIA